MNSKDRMEMIELLSEMLETHLDIKNDSGQKLFKKNTLDLIDRALQALLADIVIGA